MTSQLQFREMDTLVSFVKTDSDLYLEASDDGGKKSQFRRCHVSKMCVTWATESAGKRGDRVNPIVVMVTQPMSWSVSMRVPPIWTCR